MVDVLDMKNVFSGMIPDSATLLMFLRNFLIILGIIVLGVVAFVFINHRKKKKQGGGLKEIDWWEEINESLVPVESDKAEEIIIPGTSLRVFYIKKKDMWLPRFTRAIRPNLFYVTITPNKEIINFKLKSLTEDLKSAGLEFDHTDMRWAAENIKEFIKRNFRDKATPWWKEYQGLITGIAYILVTTFCLGILLYMFKDLMDQISDVVSQLGAQCEAVMGQGSSGTLPSGAIEV